MALKTLQVPSSFARPINNCSLISLSQHYFQPKLPSGLGARIAGQRRRRSSSTAVECRAGNLHGCVDEGAVASRQDQAAEIPIVLFPSVVFPGATVQLQAFEFRYRIMVHTLLQEGLTRFGVVYSGGGVDGVAEGKVGCVAHLVECERLVDGRFFLTCVGGDRFRVVGVVRTKPYVIARIQLLTDTVPGQDQQQHHGGLVERVEEHLRNVAMLADKLGWRLPSGGRQQQPLLCRTAHSPASFSFAVAREFVEDRLEQQALLRLDDAAARLAREGRYLERRSKYLAAIAAIKDALGHLYCNDK